MKGRRRDRAGVPPAFLQSAPFAARDTLPRWKASRDGRQLRVRAPAGGAQAPACGFMGSATTGVNRAKTLAKAARAANSERMPPKAQHAPLLLYGWHTVEAALRNPARHVHRLYATKNAARRLAETGVPLAIEPQLVRPDAIARRLTP